MGRNEIWNYTEICFDRKSSTKYNTNFRRRQKRAPIHDTHTYIGSHWHSFNHVNLFACVRFRLCSRLWACSIKYWNEISEKGCLRPPEHSESAHTDTQPRYIHIHSLINFWTDYAVCISSLSLIDGTRFIGRFLSRNEKRAPNTVRKRSTRTVTSQPWPPLPSPVGVMHIRFEHSPPRDSNSCWIRFSTIVMQSFRCVRLNVVRDQLTIRRRRKMFSSPLSVNEREIVVSVCHLICHILFDSSTW